MGKIPGLLALVLAANVLVFWKTASFQPVMLDEAHLIHEKWDRLKSAGNLIEVFKRDAFGTRDIGYYRPALNLTFMADALFSGAEFRTEVFHRGNLLLHLTGAALGFFLFLRAGLSPGTAAGGALLLSLHPALSGAVAWLPGRNDSLLFCMSAASLLFLNSAAAGRNPAFFLAHLFFFLAALLTKETALALVVLFPFQAALFTGRPAARFGTKEKLIAAGGWAACLGLYWAMRSSALTAQSLPLPGAGELLFRAGAYTAAVFAPFGTPAFAVFQDMGRKGVLLANAAGFSALAALWFFRRDGRIAAAAAAMCLFVLPVAVSDRFQPQRNYLPVFFFALALCAAAERFAGRKKAGPVLAAAALLLGAGTWSSLGRFGGPEPFWNSVMKASPNCPEVFWPLGYSAHLRGDTAAAEKFYLRVIELNPREPDARNNLGVIYKNAGRYAEAAKCYEGEIALSPGDPKPLGNMANLLAVTGDWNGAAGYYRRALSLLPDDRKTRERLVFSLLKAGRENEAAGYAKPSGK